MALTMKTIMFAREKQVEVAKAILSGDVKNLFPAFGSVEESIDYAVENGLIEFDEEEDKIDTEFMIELSRKIISYHVYKLSKQVVSDIYDFSNVAVTSYINEA